MPKKVMPNASEMLAKLDAFTRQRPGFEPGNYSDYAGLRYDMRRASRYLRPTLENIERLQRLAALGKVTAKDIRNAAPLDRLTWDEKAGAWDYTTGQYFPTEYRVAAYRVSSMILEAVGHFPALVR